MRFAVLAGAFGLLLGAGALAFLKLLPRRQSAWRTLPRERRLGTVLGFVCLAWSAMLVRPLLEGGLAPLRGLLPVFVVVLTAGSFFYLDYVLTRSVGGLLLLCSTGLMHEAFVAHAPWRPLLSVVCYLAGTAGMAMIAWPFRFRDLLRRGSTDQRFARAVAAGLGVCAASCLLVAALSYGH